MTVTEQIKQKALALGFDLVGITDALPVHSEQVNRLLGWLNAGYAGQMTWMHRNLGKRTNPAELLPGAKSVIVVGLGYKPPGQKTEDRGRPPRLLGTGEVSPEAEKTDENQPVYSPGRRRLRIWRRVVIRRGWCVCRGFCASRSFGPRGRH